MDDSRGIYSGPGPKQAAERNYNGRTTRPSLTSVIGEPEEAGAVDLAENEVATASLQQRVVALERQVEEQHRQISMLASAIERRLRVVERAIG